MPVKMITIFHDTFMKETKQRDVDGQQIRTTACVLEYNNNNNTIQQ